MRMSSGLLCLGFAALCGFAWGAGNEKSPHVGYLYPGGGRQGAVFTATAGGQYLNGIKAVYVSGEGVSAKIVEYARPLSNKQLREVPRQLRLLRQERAAAESGKPVDAVAKPADKSDLTDAQIEEIRNHPLFRRLSTLTPEQAQEVAREYVLPKKRQPNAQLNEMVTIEVTVDSGAAPGNRELRFATAGGLTNPLRFQVGTIPEVCEDEPFGLEMSPAPVQDVPVVFNGQTTPGDVDRYRFRAKKGQELVIEAWARGLMPYLADAVPGWFQAVMSLYDASGKEVAFADDYLFNPDPVLHYKIAADGEYTLEIRDSIYRGREDFVYRVAVSEQPFVTSIFPLGGPAGESLRVSASGWNLPGKSLTLDTSAGADNVRETDYYANAWLSTPVRYGVDSLPECEENESNDTAKKAQEVSLPQIVNGRISKPGDVDVFQFKGKADEEVVVEVYARRLNSPLDSLLRLTDDSGKTVGSNDDLDDKTSGLLTHHADSYLRVRLPKDGTYCVELSDSQRHGGSAYGYRLRISAPRPDFVLRITPSSVNAPVGRSVPVCVYALRKDGFDGDIDIVLKDAPAGFGLSGNRIPSGRDSVRMTIKAPPDPCSEPVALQVEGRAQAGGETVCRTAVPAEDMMQAFAYWHLVPSQELLVSVVGKNRGSARIEVVGDSPVRVPLGGTAQVSVKAPKFKKIGDVRLELREPPAGVSLQDVAVVPDGVTLTLAADSKTAKAGPADNLIVDAYIESEPKPVEGKPSKGKQRSPLGVLPAIPIEIVQP